jgi:hypothetical protein
VTNDGYESASFRQMHDRPDSPSEEPWSIALRDAIAIDMEQRDPPSDVSEARVSPTLPPLNLAPESQPVKINRLPKLDALPSVRDQGNSDLPNSVSIPERQLPVLGHNRRLGDLQPLPQQHGSGARNPAGTDEEHALGGTGNRSNLFSKRFPGGSWFAPMDPDKRKSKQNADQNIERSTGSLREEYSTPRK